MYIRCTESLNLRKISNLLNLGYRENSMKNCVHWMHKKSRFIVKFKFIKCTISRKFSRKVQYIRCIDRPDSRKKLNLLNVRNRQNSKEN